jgi:hypothetical protein
MPINPSLDTAGIRREILSVLAGSDTMTVPAATAQVAAAWSARRRQRGFSPAAVTTLSAFIHQVGVDLASAD